MSDVSDNSRHIDQDEAEKNSIHSSTAEVINTEPQLRKRPTGPPTPPFLGSMSRLSVSWLSPLILSQIMIIISLVFILSLLPDITTELKNEYYKTCVAYQDTSQVVQQIPTLLYDKAKTLEIESIKLALEAEEKSYNFMIDAVEGAASFFIDTYKSFLFCVVDLIINASLGAAVDLLEDADSFINATFNTVRTEVQDAVEDINNVVEDFVKVINKLPAVNVTAPQMDVPSLAALQNTSIASGVIDDIHKLNSSIPTFSDMKETLEGFLFTPLEKVRTLLNTTFDDNINALSSRFNNVSEYSANRLAARAALAVADSTDTCENLDTEFIDNIAHYIRLFAIIALVLILIFILSTIAFHLYWEHRTHKRLDRVLALFSAPRTGNTANTAYFYASVMEHSSLLNYWYTKIKCPENYVADTRFKRFNKSLRSDNTLWFFQYVTQSHASYFLLAGVAGIITVQILLAILLGPVQNIILQETAKGTQSTLNTIDTLVATQIQQESQYYVTSMNTVISTITTDINTGALDWVEASTSAMNSTLDEFYTYITTTISDVFNNTILEYPVESFVYCVIGSKVEDIEKALTYINRYAHLELPTIPDNSFNVSLSSYSSSINLDKRSFSDSSSSITDSTQEYVLKLLNQLAKLLRQQQLTFFVCLIIWGIILVFGFIGVYFENNPIAKQKVVEFITEHGATVLYVLFFVPTYIGKKVGPFFQYEHRYKDAYYEDQRRTLFRPLILGSSNKKNLSIIHSDRVPRKETPRSENVNKTRPSELSHSRSSHTLRGNEDDREVLGEPDISVWSKLGLRNKSFESSTDTTLRSDRQGSSFTLASVTGSIGLVAFDVASHISVPEQAKKLTEFTHVREKFTNPFLDPKDLDDPSTFFLNPPIEYFKPAGNPFGDSDDDEGDAEVSEYFPNRGKAKLKYFYPELVGESPLRTEASSHRQLPVGYSNGRPREEVLAQHNVMTHQREHLIMGKDLSNIELDNPSAHKSHTWPHRIQKIRYLVRCERVVKDETGIEIEMSGLVPHESETIHWDVDKKGALYRVNSSTGTHTYPEDKSQAFGANWRAAKAIAKPDAVVIHMPEAQYDEPIAVMIEGQGAPLHRALSKVSYRRARVASLVPDISTPRDNCKPKDDATTPSEGLKINTRPERPISVHTERVNGLLSYHRPSIFTGITSRSGSLPSNDGFDDSPIVKTCPPLPEEYIQQLEEKRAKKKRRESSPDRESMLIQLMRGEVFMVGDEEDEDWNTTWDITRTHRVAHTEADIAAMNALKAMGASAFKHSSGHKQSAKEKWPYKETTEQYSNEDKGERRDSGELPVRGDAYAETSYSTGRANDPFADSADATEYAAEYPCYPQTPRKGLNKPALDDRGDQCIALTKEERNCASSSGEPRGKSSNEFASSRGSAFSSGIASPSGYATSSGCGSPNKSSGVIKKNMPSLPALPTPAALPGQHVRQ